MLDTIFEVAYTLFPLLNLTHSSIWDLTSLAQLRGSDVFFTFQAILAVSFLASKCWYLMSELDPAYIEKVYYHHKREIAKGIYTEHKPWILTRDWIKYEYKLQLRMKMLTPHTTTHEMFATSETPTDDDNINNINNIDNINSNSSNNSNNNNDDSNTDIEMNNMSSNSKNPSQSLHETIKSKIIISSKNDTMSAASIASGIQLAQGPKFSSKAAKLAGIDAGMLQVKPFNDRLTQTVRGRKSPSVSALAANAANMRRIQSAGAVLRGNKQQEKKNNNANTRKRFSDISMLELNVPARTPENDNSNINANDDDDDDDGFYGVGVGVGVGAGIGIGIGEREREIEDKRKVKHDSEQSYNYTKTISNGNDIDNEDIIADFLFGGAQRNSITASFFSNNRIALGLKQSIFIDIDQDRRNNFNSNPNFRSARATQDFNFNFNNNNNNNSKRISGTKTLQTQLMGNYFSDQKFDIQDSGFYKTSLVPLLRSHNTSITETQTIFGLHNKHNNNNNNNNNKYNNNQIEQEQDKFLELEHLYDDLDIDGPIKSIEQRRRKLTVGICGLLFLVIGLAIIGAFLVASEDYENKCFDNNNNNDNDNTEWIALHPEIKLYYDENCQHKTIHAFQENPCNCRHFALSTNHFPQFLVNEYNLTIFEKLFLEWTMLEGIYIRIRTSAESIASSEQIHFNLTKLLLKLEFLQMLYLEGINIGTIDDNIDEYLGNLEILMLSNIQTPITIPWTSIGKITKLKALGLETINELRGDIGDSLCDLTELRYLSFRYAEMVNGTKLPDCIGYRLNKLKYFELSYGYDPNNQRTLPSGIYNLDNIQTVLIEYWPLDITSFEEFNGYSKTLRDVWFSHSEICNHDLVYNDDDSGMIWINGSDSYSYSDSDDDGFDININMTNLDYAAIIYNNSKLEEFIEKYDPCTNPCTVDQDDTPCTSFVWGDGVCDIGCFDEECFYDNGDCSQLCDCNLTILGNGICDEECNTTECYNDYYDCIDKNDTCFVDENNPNKTCYTEWMQTYDVWCDENCRTKEECNFDGGVCSRCQDECFEVFYYIMTLMGSIYEPKLVITVDEVCGNWDTVLYVCLCACVCILVILFCVFVFLTKNQSNVNK